MKLLPGDLAGCDFGAHGETVRREHALRVGYGDCLADVDVGELVAHHREQGRLVTVTALQPPPAYGQGRAAVREVLVRYAWVPWARPG